MTAQREFRRRELRGLAIVAKGGMVKRIDESTYLVRSSDLQKLYKVSWNGKGWKCECKDYAKRCQSCKHVYAVLFLNRLPFMLMANFQSSRVTCSKCGSDRVIRKGLTHNKGFASQRYKCKNCHHRFSDNDATKGLKGNPLAVVAAADLYFKGLSLRTIEDHMKKIYSVNVSYPTLHRWVKRFIVFMKTLEKEHSLKVGKRWHVDETQVKIRGKRHYLWNVLDAETRILLASIVTFGRGDEEAEMVIREALRKAATAPKEIVTDGLMSYKAAVRNVFDAQVSHLFKARFTAPRNNNIVERLNGTLKARIKGFRRLDNEASSSQLFEGMRLYYNFLRPHSALGGIAPAAGQRSTQEPV